MDVLQISMEQLQKKQRTKTVQNLELLPDDKKLFNLLEIRIFDLSQTLEIIAKQLTNNQLKDIVSQSFNISQQLEAIFSHSKVPFLYSVFRKMQVNNVLITNILTERLEKILSNKSETTCQCQHNQPPPQKTLQNPFAIIQKNVLSQDTKQTILHPLGGIHLYNQSHRRGLSREESSKEMEAKQKRKSDKSPEKAFLESLMDEMNSKADVQVDGIRDEIKNYILNYKQCTKVANFISCETQINQIIDFFKVTEREASKFLNKAPHQNLQFTQDYINRLDDLEHQIRSKSSSEKDQSIQKLKLFISKLKQKVSEIEKLYEQKNEQLLMYEKKLKKVNISFSTQTHDGYYKKIKELQSTIRELEEKNTILNDIRKSENLFMVEINNLTQNLQLKINQNRKLGNINTELEDQLLGLKKVIRENHQKIAPLKEYERKKKKLASKNTISSPSETPPFQEHNFKNFRERKNEKRLKKFERGSSNSKRGSYIGTAFRDSQKTSQSHIDEREQTEEQSKHYLDIPRVKSLQYGAFPDSGFKNELRKSHPKRTLEDDRQVSFQITPSNRETFTELLSRETEDINRETQNEKSLENSRSMISIQAEYTRRSTSKKSTLKQRKQTPVTSIKNIDSEQPKKSWNKIPSKKCIILKQNKEKSRINTMLKIEPFSIFDQYSLKIEPFVKHEKMVNSNQNKKRIERTSYPLPATETDSKSVDKACQFQEILQPKKKIPSNKDFKKRGTHQPSIPSQLSRTDSVKSITQIESTKGKRVNGLRKVDSLKIQKGKNTINTSQNSTLQHFPKGRHPINIIEDPQGQSPPSSTEMNVTAPSAIQKQSTKQGTIKELVIKQYSRLPSEDLPQLSHALKKVLKNLEGIKKNAKQNRGKKSTSKKESLPDIQQILEELEHSNLSIDEFQQILQQISEDDSNVVQLLQNSKGSKAFFQQQRNKVFEPYSKESAFERKFKKVPVDIPQNNPNQTFSNKISPNQTCNSYLSPNQTCNSYLSPNQTFHSELGLDTKLSYEAINKFWALKGISVSTLQKIHSKYGTCSLSQGSNKICEHIHSYLNIINRINNGLNSNKVALKLPIEKIGVMDQKKVFKSRQKQIGTYIKAFQTTEQRNEKQGALPLINNQTNSFYKPKSKAVR